MMIRGIRLLMEREREREEYGMGGDETLVEESNLNVLSWWLYCSHLVTFEGFGTFYLNIYLRDLRIFIIHRL